MTPKIKYALKLSHRVEYLRDKETRDAYTDDLGDTQLFDSATLAAAEKMDRDRIVPIFIDDENGAVKMSPLEFFNYHDSVSGQLAEAQQTIARQGEIIQGIDRDLTKLRLALVSIADRDIIGSSAIAMKSIAQEALREGSTQS